MLKIHSSGSPGNSGNFLAIQWLGLQASTAGDMGSIPGQGTRIPHAAWHGPKQNKTTKTETA